MYIYSSRCDLLSLYTLQAPERPYAFPGERWVLTAKALQVLHTVLLQYPVNHVRKAWDGEEDSELLPEELIRLIEADFHESAEYLQVYNGNVPVPIHKYIYAFK